MFGPWYRAGLLLLLVIQLNGERNCPLPHTNYMDLSLRVYFRFFNAFYRMIREYCPVKTKEFKLTCTEHQNHLTAYTFDCFHCYKSKNKIKPHVLTLSICKNHWM